MTETMAMAPLPKSMLDALSEERFAAVRTTLGIIGFTVVGSAAYLPPRHCDGDMDIVLLSTSTSEPEAVLPALLEALRAAEASDGGVPVCGPGSVLWYVQAVASLIKVVRGTESMDLLMATGCRDNGVVADAASSHRTFRAYPSAEACAVLPEWGSRSADCVMLTSLVQRALGGGGGVRGPPTAPTTAFTVPALLALRQWAKARHIYGTRYGFPGGCTGRPPCYPGGRPGAARGWCCSSCTAAGTTRPSCAPRNGAVRPRMCCGTSS